MKKSIIKEGSEVVLILFLAVLSLGTLAPRVEARGLIGMSQNMTNQVTKNSKKTNSTNKKANKGTKSSGSVSSITKTINQAKKQATTTSKTNKSAQKVLNQNLKQRFGYGYTLASPTKHAKKQVKAKKVATGGSGKGGSGTQPTYTGSSGSSKKVVKSSSSSTKKTTKTTTKTASKKYEIKIDRAPRINIVQRDKKNALVFEAVDNVGVKEVSVQTKQNGSWKANKSEYIKYTKGSKKTKITIAAAFFKENKEQQIRIIARDKDANINTLKETITVKRLKKANSYGNWYIVDMPAPLTFSENTGKKYATKDDVRKSDFKIVANKSTGVEGLQVKDYYADKVIKEISNGTNVEATIKTKLSKCKEKNGMYKLYIKAKTKGAVREETVIVNIKE